MTDTPKLTPEETTAAIAKALNEATDVTGNSPHPIRKKVQPIYTVKTLPAGIRDYLIKAHKETLQAGRIVRAVNNALSVSEMRSITIFDLYAIWVQLMSLKVVADARPNDCSAVNEFTVRQFASFFREWLRGGTRDMCYAAAVNSRKNYAGMNADAIKFMRKFSDKMFATLSARKREVTDTIKARSRKPGDKSQGPVLTSNLPAPINTNTPHHTVIQLVTELLSYAAVTKFNNIPSMVIPLESEVLAYIRGLSSRGARIHGLIGAIRLLFGESYGNRKPAEEQPAVLALASPPNQPVDRVLPTNKKPAKPRDLADTLTTNELTPLNQQSKPTPEPEPSEPDEPLFDTGDSLPDNTILEHIDPSVEIDVKAIIEAAETACEPVDMGNRNGSVDYTSIELKDKEPEEKEEEAACDPLDSQAQEPEEVEMQWTQAGIEPVDRVKPRKPTSIEKKDTAVAEEKASKATAEEKKKEANDRMKEAVRAEHGTSMKERLGKSNILDD